MTVNNNNIVDFESAIIARAATAWKRIRQGVHDMRADWRDVGEALRVGRQQNKSNQAFGQWVKDNDFDDIDRATRAAAMWFAENYDGILPLIAEHCADATNPHHIKRCLEPLYEPHTTQDDTDDGDNSQAEHAETDNSDVEETTESGEQLPKAKKRGPKSGLEKMIGAEGADTLNQWFSKPAIAAITKATVDKRNGAWLAELILSNVKTGEICHAPVRSSTSFDPRMAWPHIPRSLAKYIANNTKTVTAYKKEADRLDEVSNLCNAASVYQEADGDGLCLRTEEQERIIAARANQFWTYGKFGTVMENATARTDDAERMPGAEVVFYGRTIYPPKAYLVEAKGKDAPDVPGEMDAAAASWFAEDLGRYMASHGDSPTAQARRLRQLAIHVERIKKPAAAALVLRDIADAIINLEKNPGDINRHKLPPRPVNAEL